MKPVSQKQSSKGVLEKGALKNFSKFTGKHLSQSLFFKKVIGLRNLSLQNNSGGCFHEG